MKKAAEKVLSKVRTKKHSWMTNELDSCDKRRKLKSIKKTSTENAQEDVKINSILRKCMKDTKEMDTEILFIYRPGYTPGLPIKHLEISQIRA